MVQLLTDPTSSEEHGAIPQLSAAGCTCNESKESRRASKDDVFIGLLNDYRRRGGLARVRDLAQRLQPRCAEPCAMLASWLNEQRLFGFEWNDVLWIPLFQLDQQLTPRPSVEAVSLELRGDLKDWEMALWFVTPNSWLAGIAPVDALIGDPEAVRQAARADRFAAKG